MTSQVDIARGLFFFKPPSYQGEDVDVKAWTDQLEAYLGERFTQLDVLLRGGLRWENLRSKLILGTTVSSGAPPITVTGIVHGLGKVPEMVSFLARDRALRFFVGTADKAAWTTNTLQFSEDIGTGGDVDIFVF